MKQISMDVDPFLWTLHAHFPWEMKPNWFIDIYCESYLYTNDYHKIVREMSDRVVRKLAKFLHRCTIHYPSIYGDSRNMMYLSPNACLFICTLFHEINMHLMHLFCILSLPHVLTMVLQLDNKQFFTRIRLFSRRGSE